MALVVIGAVIAVLLLSRPASAGAGAQSRVKQALRTQRRRALQRQITAMRERPEVMEAVRWLKGSEARLRRAPRPLSSVPHGATVPTPPGALAAGSRVPGPHVAPPTGLITSPPSPHGGGAIGGTVPASPVGRAASVGVGGQTSPASVFAGGSSHVPVDSPASAMAAVAAAEPPVKSFFVYDLDPSWEDYLHNLAKDKGRQKARAGWEKVKKGARQEAFQKQLAAMRERPEVMEAVDWLKGPEAEKYRQARLSGSQAAPEGRLSRLRNFLGKHGKKLAAAGAAAGVGAASIASTVMNDNDLEIEVAPKIGAGASAYGAPTTPLPQPTGPMAAWYQDAAQNFPTAASQPPMAMPAGYQYPQYGYGYQPQAGYYGGYYPSQTYYQAVTTPGVTAGVPVWQQQVRQPTTWSDYAR